MKPARGHPHGHLTASGRAILAAVAGRCPNHYNYRPANIVSVSSPVTTQVPQCGVAFAIKLRGEGHGCDVRAGRGRHQSGRLA